MRTASKLIVCWIAFIVALVGFGILSQAVHLPQITPPGHTSTAVLFAAQLFGGALLVLGLFPAARGLAASAAVRSLVMVAFLFLVLGVNGVIETRAFSHLLDGRAITAVLLYAVQALLVGIALGVCFGASGPATGLARRGMLAASGRGVAAWLAWPVIYTAFGMSIAPIVMPYYNAGIAALRIPPLSTIVEIQLVRSIVFLAVSLPFIALWNGSRRGLWGALGSAHAFVVGIHQLAGATFLPWVLRVTHSIEITADSFAYAGLLVLLFAAPARQRGIAAPPPPEARTVSL